jgi:DNA-binding transcriptional LysR family regulator
LNFFPAVHPQIIYLPFLNPPNTTFLVLPYLFGIMEPAMELRHLRYFLAVGEALNFTRVEGKLFLEELRELLKCADESVEKVRALARGEYGELHIGYAPSPTVEILPPALAAFQKSVPRVKVLLHWPAPQKLIQAL